MQQGTRFPSLSSYVAGEDRAAEETGERRSERRESDERREPEERREPNIYGRKRESSSGDTLAEITFRGTNARETEVM